MIELLVPPVCFLVAGVLGYRLGTPFRVAAGLVAFGLLHPLAFLLSARAAQAVGAPQGILHFFSQSLFLLGFASLVWLAATYPDRRPSTAVVAAAGALAVGGPVILALSGPSPAVLSQHGELGPVVELLPADVSVADELVLLGLPLLAVGTFTVRYWRADRDDQRAMRWPVAGLGALVLAILVGALLGDRHQGVSTGLFYVSMPVFPLAVAFGPVFTRLDSLSTDVEDLSRRLRIRPPAPPGMLARLTPRELTVLEAMADGAANPVIARSMHLSLSSVEKHATSIFRKLDVAEGPEVHRRVAAVVAYRDAIETSGPEQPPTP